MGQFYRIRVIRVDIILKDTLSTVELNELQNIFEDSREQTLCISLQPKKKHQLKNNHKGTGNTPAKTDNLTCISLPPGIKSE